MNVQVILREGEPEYAVLPWAEYQALLQAAGHAPAAAGPSRAVPQPARPSLSELPVLREQKGLSLDALARSVGISPTYLEMIERGERVPSDAIRFGLARALQVDGWRSEG